jgi:hypothetical protein
MLSPDFATTLLMPALSASFMSCSQSLAVNMIIRIRGAVCDFSCHLKSVHAWHR